MNDFQKGTRTSFCATTWALTIGMLSAWPNDGVTIPPADLSSAKILDVSTLSESDAESLKTIRPGRQLLRDKANPDEVRRQRIIAYKPYLCKQAQWEDRKWMEQFIGDVEAQNEVSICVVDRGDDDFKYIVWTALRSPADGSRREKWDPAPQAPPR